MTNLGKEMLEKQRTERHELIRKVFHAAMLPHIDGLEIDSIDVTEFDQSTSGVSDFKRELNAINMMIMNGALGTATQASSDNQVQFNFTAHNSYNQMIALKDALVDMTGVHVSCSNGDVSFHESSEELLANLDADRLKTSVSRKMANKM